MKGKKGEGETKGTGGEGEGHDPRPTNQTKPLTNSRQKAEQAARRSKRSNLCELHKELHKNDDSDNTRLERFLALIHPNSTLSKKQGEGQTNIGQKRFEKEPGLQTGKDFNTKKKKLKQRKYDNKSVLIEKFSKTGHHEIKNKKPTKNPYRPIRRAKQKNTVKKGWARERGDGKKPPTNKSKRIVPANPMPTEKEADATEVSEAADEPEKRRPKSHCRIGGRRLASPPAPWRGKPPDNDKWGGRSACGFIRSRFYNEAGPRSCAPPGLGHSTRRLSPPVPSLARRKVQGTGISEAARPLHIRVIGQIEAKPLLASPATSNFTLPAQGIDSKNKIIERKKGRREGKKGEDKSKSPEKQDYRKNPDRNFLELQNKDGRRDESQDDRRTKFHMPD